ncbi:MAG: McrC family protein [Roseateles sp.]|uniref:McrC family protein n=1 Tax=Roseateles sp. TaxID=1971397 RepID=UPI0040351F94
MSTSKPLARDRVLTALEHRPLPITADGAGWSLTPAEAERLAQIGELRPGFCERGAHHVKLAQYCGVVGLGDRVLEVLPKVDDTATSAEDCRGVLLRLLSRTERFAHFKHQATGQHLRRMPLLEVFITAFFDSVASLVRGGLLRQYRELDAELQVVRGRIDLGRQFGAHANRPDRLTCHFDELTADNVWNRTLKKAIRCTRAWIRRADLHRRWVELMGLLDVVDDTRLVSAELERLQFNRQAERYRTAVDWARWILEMLAPSLRAGVQQAPALLFDMNKLFESAVAAEARHQLRGSAGLSVDTQDGSRFLGALVGGERVKEAFQLRPDLVFRQGSVVIAIADTKWKMISADRHGHLLPSGPDLYQMHAYAAAFGCHELQLIYPWHAALASTLPSEIRLPEVRGRFPALRVNCIDVYDDEMNLLIGRWPHRLS